MGDPGSRSSDVDTQIDRWRKRKERTSSLSPPELDELEDHLRGRVGVLLEANAELPPKRAFAIARRELGKSPALSREFAKSGKPRWRKLLLAGWALYAASFLLPTTTAQWNAGAGMESGPVWGWQAFVGALLLAGGSPDWLLKLSGVSNILVLATFLKLRGKRPPSSAWLTCGLTGAALFNLYWGASGFDVRVGYWIWVASFACIASALGMRAGEWASARPTASRPSGQGVFE